jgi:hypothetical protein
VRQRFLEGSAVQQRAILEAVGSNYTLRARRVSFQLGKPLELVADALSSGVCTGAAFGRPSLAADAPPDGRDFVRVFIPEREDSPGLRSADRGWRSEP